MTFRDTLPLLNFILILTGFSGSSGSLNFIFSGLWSSTRANESKRRFSIEALSPEALSGPLSQNSMILVGLLGGCAYDGLNTVPSGREMLPSMAFAASSSLSNSTMTFLRPPARVSIRAIFPNSANAASTWDFGMDSELPFGIPT
ncbi:hypothetical protein C8J56DRAFT_957152 [Mycena floridula]|nr:hypothetical protein C8J56DRAFT_957152 [Mycena floridula]